jgi:hypothetical protein
MRRVSVYRRADTYYVQADSKIPTRRDGPHGGYAHLRDEAVTIASTELARLGSVVRQLLAAKA